MGTVRGSGGACVSAIEIDMYVRPLTQITGKTVWLICRMNPDTIVGCEDTEQEAITHARRVVDFDIACGRAVEIHIQSPKGKSWRIVSGAGQ